MHHIFIVKNFWFSVYPSFELISKNKFTINGGRQPEGYITDYPFSAILSSFSEDPVSDIQINIGNLPKTATITFDLEEINMAASNEPRFTIAAKSVFALDEFYRTTQAVVNQKVMVYSSRDLRVLYHAKNMSYHKEYVRIKYSGSCKSLY